MQQQKQERGAIPLAIALIPVAVLILLLVLSVVWFGDQASSGPSQIALLLGAASAAMIGLARGEPWADIEQGIILGIANAMIAVLILLIVGALIGSWMLAGTVQTLIYYGLDLVSADWFYAAACLVSALAAVSIGSSWTVAGTLGVAFMGLASALQLDPAIAAGAVISGAYFGDKLSPLSDTANLTAAITETPLFLHIRACLWTSAPAFIVALLAYVWLGGGAAPVPADVLAGTRERLGQQFALGLHLLSPMLLVAVLAWRRVPALITLTVGALAGSLVALMFQQEAIARFLELPGHGGESAREGVGGALMATWWVLADGFRAVTGDPALDDLLSRGGMTSMLPTVWLIICAMTFGAVMEQTGLLNRIMTALLARVRSVTGLVFATVVTCVGMNLTTSEQYISIVLPGRMFRLEFARHGLASTNLSRTIADSSIVTSALIPWNTCGAYMAATLGVATLSYLPYAFFNLLGPVVVMAFVAAHFRLMPLSETEAAAFTGD